jgi:hypothetical protein
MITEAIEKGRGLHQYFHEICEPAPAKDRHVEKRAALYHLGTVIGKLHARGICHGDLRWGNVLVDRSHGGQPRVVFLDNERTSSHPRIPDRKRLKNLVQLNIGSDPLITRTDRLRFFQAYLEENPELLSEKKKWMRWILKKTISRLAKRSQDGVPTNGSWSQSAC